MLGAYRDGLNKNKMQHIEVNKELLRGVGLEKLASFCKDSDEVMAEPGEQHYKLLAYLTAQVKGHVVDVGTHYGNSAAALSYGGNKVYSFDINKETPVDFEKNLPNCEFILANLWETATREKYKDLLLKSELVFMDVDPHNGEMEIEMYNWFKENSYQGIVVWDDIWFFKEMRDKFWCHVVEKVDVSLLGHFSGTGITTFGGKYEVSTSPCRDTRDWTMVTGYFDLTKCSDASSSIVARDFEYYLSHSRGTLGLDVNMIIFCEEKNIAAIKELRPKHLLAKTRFISQDFENFPLTKYRAKIIDNRTKMNYHFDDRNTASYYLLCMSRFAMLKTSIEFNPFNSEFFGWINFCEERMGYKNLLHLEEAMLAHRRRFSTCYIDFADRKMAKDLAKFFEHGGRVYSV